MAAFLKYIFIGYLIYIVIKQFSKLFKGGISPQNQFRSNRKEGSINIKTKQSHKEEKHVSGGEYVDFEEVE